MDIQTTLRRAQVTFQPISQRGTDFLAEHAARLDDVPILPALSLIYRAAGHGLVVVDTATGLEAKARD